MPTSLASGSDAAVTVWFCRTDRWSEAAARTQCSPWLDPSERARWQNFVFAHDRHLYLVAHGLLRWALSAAMPAVAPAEWRFRVGAYGRPVLDGPGETASVTFSVSHTAGRAAVAIGVGRTGLDVEARRGPDDTALAAAAAAFAPAERAWLQRQAPARRAVAALRLWTLKEAFAKACGLGLHLPFESFSFALRERRGVSHFEPPDPIRNGESWRFLEAGPGSCRLALAFEPPAQHAAPSTVRLAMTQSGRWARGRSVTLLFDGDRWRMCHA